MYNPLTKWLRRIGMPTYYPTHWEDYTVRVVNDSLFRQIITIYSFLANTDAVPYFYSTWLSFTLLIKRNNFNEKVKALNYKWRLVMGDKDEIVDGKTGEGTLKLHKWWIFSEKSHAIELKRLKKQDQYRLQIEITDRDKISPYFDVLEFTIKDKDEYGMNIFWIVISAIIGATIGAIVGSSI